MEMEIEIQKRNAESKRKTIILIVLAVFILLMLSAAAVFIFKMLQNSRVYKGVQVAGQNVSGLDAQELKLALDNKYQTALDELYITLKTERAELKKGYTELDVKYDTETAALNAYAVGREGSILKRLYDIARAGINGVSFDVPLVLNEDKLDDYVNQFYEMTFVNVKESDILLTDSIVKIYSGNHGESIDRAKTKELVKTFIRELKTGVAEPEVIITPKSNFDVDDLYEQIIREPADAYYTVENSELILKPHTVGRQIDKSIVENIIKELEQKENEERILPVVYTEPAITSEAAESMLFRDELATYTTSFSTATENGRNRKFNMSLAADKINSVILLPGQEFSFNEVVGPRDVEHGYKPAHVYMQGKIVDGIGGGICQVSSTMYNSVLLADLKVNERRNHSFTVGYVPLGQDATAYYGGTDFRFVNSTGWPIKLYTSVVDNKITFSIYGTNETPEKSVIISNKVLNKTPFTTKYTADPTLPVGKIIERQEGLDGYVVETYKIIKMNGKVVSQTKLHTSKYNPSTRDLLVGVLLPDGTTTTTSAAISPSPNTTKPADPAKPTDTVDTANPAEPIDPSRPAEPTEPTETEKPAEPTEPSGSAKPIEPTRLTEPTEPTEPAVPVDPPEPSMSSDPSEPAKPTAPADTD